MSLTNWHEDAAVNGWNMPLVPRWWRWWGVRHVRWWMWRDVTRWGLWARFGMWHGMDKGADE